MTDFESVSVVIPQWNRADLLRQLLKHLSEQTYPIVRTIVVDNGSTDRSVAEARDAGATVIELGRNRGFAAAVNCGIQAADTEWIAILNNDVTLERDWLEQLLNAAGPSNAWFATGKLLTAADPSILDGTFDLVSAGGAAWRCGSGRKDSPLWSEPKRIRFAPFTAAVFRRTVFDRVGLLDERFESYLEDVDFGIRSSIGGLGGVYVPAAKARHLGSATRGAWHKTTVRQIARNQLFIVAKHFRGAPLWPIVVGQLLWGLLALRHMAPFAWLRGVWEGLRGFRSMRRGGSEWGAIRRFVEASEQDIFQFQSRDGFDFYWRCYFMLGHLMHSGWPPEGEAP